MDALPEGMHSRVLCLLPSQIIAPLLKVQRSVGSKSCRGVLPACLRHMHGKRRSRCRENDEPRELFH